MSPPCAQAFRGMKLTRAHVAARKKKATDEVIKSPEERRQNNEGGRQWAEEAKGERADRSESAKYDSEIMRRGLGMAERPSDPGSLIERRSSRGERCNTFGVRVTPLHLRIPGEFVLRSPAGLWSIIVAAYDR